MIGSAERKDIPLQLLPLTLLLLDVLDVPAEVIQALAPNLVAAKYQASIERSTM